MNAVPSRVWLVFVRLLGCVLGCCLGLRPELVFADTYPLICTELKNGAKTEYQGTAIAIAHTTRGTLLLTAKHNLERPDSCWVSTGGDWIRCEATWPASDVDLALVEVPVVLQLTAIGDETPRGPAEVTGFGPFFHRLRTPAKFAAEIISDDELRGLSGEHVIPGDSGGPVLIEVDGRELCVGVVVSHEGDSPARSREQFPYARTQFVPASRICQFIQSQCPGGICPIRVSPRGPQIFVRPEIRQPMIGIGVPVGPPQIVGTVPPAGPAGPQGPSGRSVTRADVEACVNAWLDANADRLRGPAGPSGSPGPRGDIDVRTLRELQQRLTDIEQRPFRMVLTRDDTIVDDETYAPGEPVVLDLRKIRNAADGQ